MNKLFIFLVVAVLGIGGFLLANREGVVSPDQQSGKLSVVTSIYPMYYLAQEIAGGKAVVTNLTPAGAEPHDYELSTQDLMIIERADVLVLNGELEPWGDEVAANAKDKGVDVVVAGKHIMTIPADEADDAHAEDGGEAGYDHEGFDPHVWLDPVKTKELAGVILTSLQNADPRNASYYESRKTALDNKLDALDASYESGLASCRTRDFVTSHAAFSYLAARYDLRQVPISGLSPEEEPSARELADVARFVKNNGVKYIFFETLVSPALSETIAAESGAQTLVLDPIEGVSDDDKNAGADYITLMQANLANLQTALECKQ